MKYKKHVKEDLEEIVEKKKVGYRQARRLNKKAYYADRSDADRESVPSPLDCTESSASQVNIARPSNDHATA